MKMEKNIIKYSMTAKHKIMKSYEVGEMRIQKVEISKDLSALKAQLFAHKNNDFINNWNIIENSYKSGNLIACILDSSIIGFTTFETNNIYATSIMLFTIFSTSRGKGYGIIFYEKLKSYFCDQKVSIIELVCSPVDSLRFWKKNGFVEYGDFCENHNYTNLYAKLIPSQESVNEITKVNSIRVFSYNSNFEVLHHINFLPNSFLLPVPIIIPCGGDTNIELKVNNRVVLTQRVKRFGTGTFHVGNFLYIDSLSDFSSYFTT